MTSPTLTYKINSVNDDQIEQPDGSLQNVFDISFTVPALNNYTSSVVVPKVGTGTVEEARTEIEAAISQVAAVYALGA